MVNPDQPGSTIQLRWQSVVVPFIQTANVMSATFHCGYNDVQGNQDNRNIITIRSYHATTTNFITVNASSEPGQNAAGAARMVQVVDSSHHKQTIMEANEAANLIISIIQLLVNCTESSNAYLCMRQSIQLLHHTILMTQQALQIFEPTPLSHNLASTLMPMMLSCCEDLQHLFDKLDDY